MPILECTIFGICLIWNVLKMEYDKIEMCPFWDVLKWNVLLECELFGMSSKQNMIKQNGSFLNVFVGAGS